MNVVEKILAAHDLSGPRHLRPGMIVEIAPDLTMANDATAVLAIEVFQQKLQAEKVSDPDRVVLVMDHYTPSCSIDAAETHRLMRSFAREQRITHVYDGVGVCHQLMMEHHVRPGQLIIGADSHTCTYGALGALATGMGSTDLAVAWRTGRSWMKVPEAIRIEINGTWPAGVCAKDLVLKIIGDLTVSGATYKALIFTGPAIRALGISERMTLCNMAIEAGAKFAYIQPDDKSEAYLRAAGRAEYPTVTDDADARYARVLTYDADSLEPQVALPGSVDNVRPIDAAEGIVIDEFFLGACTNGRYEDLAVAARILKGKKVAAGARLLVTPASRDIFLRAMASGVLATLIESGAMIGNPGCSACFGGTGGILGKNERLLTTANRNFTGRVGSPDSEIFLASPAVVAASAITGRITDPRRTLQ